MTLPYVVSGPVPLVLGLPEPWGNTVLLLGSFALLLLGAEIFTNGVEWLGQRLGVSESATGSILAAVGTALPETMIPTIAIIQGVLSGDPSGANAVGVGAILGAPFLLSTIAMFLIGASVLYFAGRRSFGGEFHFNDESTRRDLSFFMVGYSLAFLAALIPSDLVSIGIGLFLVVLYVVYVYRSVTSGDIVEGEELEDLHLGEIAEWVGGDEQTESDAAPDGGARRDLAGNPPRWLVLTQTLIALGIIIGGAHLFVSEVQFFSEEVFNIPTAVVALLLAPLATELPEKFNSVLWISRDKDTLAIGNITGAMAFQGTLPVTLGILFTSWDLSLHWGTTGFLNGFSAILALISGGFLYLRARSVKGGNMSPLPFLIGGIFYVGFIAVVVYHVLVLGLSGVAGH